MSYEPVEVDRKNIPVDNNCRGGECVWDMDDHFVTDYCERHAEERVRFEEEAAYHG